MTDATEVPEKTKSGKKRDHTHWLYIAVIIAAGQLKELLGLTSPGKEPGPFVPKIAALA